MSDEHTEKKEHKIEISVNNKAVTVEAPKNTGFGIKEAAIAQGVEIQADFQLAEVVDGKTRAIIGDDEVINVHPGEKFVATGPDDNS